MWSSKYFSRIDGKVLFLIFLLMLFSLLIISSTTQENSSFFFFTRCVKSQIRAFILGWGIFFFFAGFDYQKLREWTWFLYLFMIFSLIGLYFTSAMNQVHRWYYIPFLKMTVQPSEYAKLVVVLALGWFLERKTETMNRLSCSLQLTLLLLCPFLLILKQPDLGSALVLLPIFLIMAYLGGLHRRLFRCYLWGFSLIFLFVIAVFLGILSHQNMKPYFTKFMKPYQFERLNPDTYHQRASKTAIAIGGIQGIGWKKGTFSSQKWLPAPHTDSVFSSFGEEFGLLGMGFLLIIFLGVVYRGFYTCSCAKDTYGSFLASGLTVYLAMHMVMNTAMMCGFLPISGVPLVLLTYGSNSVLVTMAALGILQSIYIRRFMF